MNRLIGLLWKIQIHPLLWVVAALAVATAHFVDLFLLLLIIMIHEFGHAAAATYYSWRVKKIVLLPFGGVAEMDEHGNRPLKEELVVVLAGPFQHLWMLALTFLFYEIGVFPEKWFSVFVEFNLMVLFFNLLPIWPLDGGKLLFIWLSMRNCFQDAHQRTLVISLGSLFIFAASILLIAPLTLNIWIIIAFLIFSLYFEWRHRHFVFMRFLMERHYGNENNFRLLKPIRVMESEFVADILGKFQRGCKHPIIVQMGNGNETAMDENELLHAFFNEKRLSAKIGDLLYTY